MVLAATAPELNDVTLLAVAAIAYGAVNCLFGYRLFRVLLGLWGAVIGGFVGWSMGAQAAGTNLALVAGLLGAVLGGVLLTLLYFLGVFVIGAMLGAMAAAAAMTLANQPPHPLVELAGAVVLGLAALKFQKLVIVLATAFGGAWAIVLGVAQLLQRFDMRLALASPRAMPLPDARAALVFATWLALGLVGATIQYTVTARPPAEEDAEGAPKPAKDKSG